MQQSKRCKKNCSYLNSEESVIANQNSIHIQCACSLHLLHEEMFINNIETHTADG